MHGHLRQIPGPQAFELGGLWVGACEVSSEPALGAAPGLVKERQVARLRHTVGGRHQEREAMATDEIRDGGLVVEREGVGYVHGLASLAFLARVTV